MANNVGVMDLLSKEVIRQFEANFMVGKTMNTQYDKNYQYQGASEGETIRIEAPARFVAVDGASASAQDDIKKQVSLTRATQKHVMLEFTSKEITQDLADDKKMAMFSKNNLETCIQTLCGSVESTVLDNLMPQVYNTVGTPGSDPSSFANILEPREVLNNFQAKKTDRFAIIGNSSMASLSGGIQNFFNPQAQKAEDYKVGRLNSMVGGFDFFETDFLPRHTNGDAVDGAITANVPAEGATSIEVDGVGATATVTKGTTFTIAGVYRRNYITKEARAELQVFTATADATAVAGVVTIPISPALEADGTKAYASVSALPVEDAVVNFEGDADGVYNQNLYFQKEAFVFATCDLADIGCTDEMTMRDEELGITLKYTSQGNVTELKRQSRLDILFGSCAVAPFWAVRQWAA